MRQPEFWTDAPDDPSLSTRLLTPVGAMFAMAGRLRRAFARPYRANAPVICVGNLVVGGAGKTPTVLALAERLSVMGVSAHILSRGYGGSISGPHRVDPDRDKASEVGDEPLLMAHRFPVWIGADRAVTAQIAEEAGADALIMDDGFQNPGVMKDLSILVIDAVYGHGNGRVMPAGPLREPLSEGFGRAQAAIFVGSPPPGGRWPWTPRRFPAFAARLAPVLNDGPLAGRRYFAFAGIGRPEKFFDTLRETGAELVGRQGFPDHHPYSEAILARLEARAQELGAQLITTEKDAVRLPERYVGRVAYLPVALGFADPDAIDELLAPIAVRARRRAQQRRY
ncbi:MAG: tetraacyldisaccharide 4'-kinase [Neomegalonema sp.]|nr:tetraacyldisaccharide 4'-kinase [Neomegalonema sp.]